MMSGQTLDPLQKAKEDLTYNVSVAGWRESLGEPILWIRRSFQCSVVFLLCCFIYYNYKNFQSFTAMSTYGDEISDVFHAESVAVSNVTICAQLYMNQTFIAESLLAPNKIIDDYQRMTGANLAEFYRRLTLFLSMISRPHAFSTIETALFSKIVASNPKLYDYSAFATLAYLQCDRMFKRCVFDGQEFDCCADAVQSFDDDGICYVLPLNRDSDNAQATSTTFRQTVPGPHGGLSIEISVSLEDFPWLDEDSQNGFKVYIDPTPYAVLLSPLTAPHAAETFIKITPSLHSLAADCAPAGHLSRMRYPELTYQDPEGLSCAMIQLAEHVSAFVGCYAPGYVFKPNSSVICSPTVLTTMGQILSSGVAYSQDSTSLGFHEQVVNGERFIRAALAAAYQSKCPKHCRYWSYASVSSFADMMRNKDGYQKTMDAKIHIYYGELSYREYAEVKKKSVYVAFCGFGSVGNFCLGMSVISFFDLSFHLVKYWRTKRRVEKYGNKGKPSKGGLRKIGRNRVAPEIVVTRDSGV